jgi:hypothetical protein
MPQITFAYQKLQHQPDNRPRRHCCKMYMKSVIHICYCSIDIAYHLSYQGLDWIVPSPSTFHNTHDHHACQEGGGRENSMPASSPSRPRFGSHYELTLEIVDYLFLVFFIRFFETVISCKSSQIFFARVSCCLL